MLRRRLGSTVFIAVLCLALVICHAAGAGQLDDLVNALAGQIESERVRARQHLPAFGTDAIPALIPLVSHEKIAISKPARDVLMDIANEVSVPGRDTARREACRLFMSMIAAGQPEATTVCGLRLLAMTVPDGFDLTPIAALLADRHYREKARVAFERIGSPEAVRALRESLRDADADFTCALLNSLGALGDSDSVETITRLALHENPRVRLATAHALALIGDPASESALTKVVEKAAEKHRPEAVDSLLLLADSVVRKHCDKKTARRIYLNVLNSSDEETLRSAALVGLGTVGDLAVIPTVLDVLDAADEDAHIRSSAVDALKCFETRGVCARVRREYVDRPTKTQLAAIEVLGARGNPESLPLLMEETQNDDERVRLAALRALGDLGQPGALDTLVEAAQTGSVDEKAVAIAAAADLADTLKTQGKRDAAGRAYTHVLELAADDAMRSRTLRGLAICPVPEAASVVISNADNPELKDESIPALAAVAAVLENAGRKREALQAYEKLYALGPSVEEMRAIVPRMKAVGSTINVARGLGFVTSWWLIGPFSDEGGEGWGTAYVGEPDVDVTTAVDSKTSWKHVVTADEMGKVNLLATVGRHDHVVAYAYTEIEVAEERKAVLRLGVDDGVKCWVNGELVWDNYVNRPITVDQDKPECRLKAGVNRILLKISQNNMGWEFCMRVTTTDGAVIPLVQRAE